MTLELLSKDTLNYYAPRFQVDIKGQKLAAEMSKTIIDVKVDEKVDVGASLTLTINDEFDMATQTYKWIDHPLFNIGNEINLKIGYSTNLFNMVKGNITSLEPNFFSGGLPTLTVEGQDLAFDYLKRAKPERAFVDMTYSDIARTIASEAGMLPVVDNAGKFTSPIRKNNEETYFAFLERLAGEVGFQFKVDGQTMYFVEPGDENKEILTLQLGKDIISFQPALRSSGLLREVIVRGHNPRDPKTPIKGRASAGSERNQESGRRTGSQIAENLNGSGTRVISNVIVNSQEHANKMASSILNKASDSLVEGQVNCIGLPQIRAGVNIRLEKMGERFTGKYYVKETTHTINNSGYNTSFKVKRNAI